MGIVEGLDKALKMKKNGNLILPDPEDPEVQKEYLGRPRPALPGLQPSAHVDRGISLRTH